MSSQEKPKAECTFLALCYLQAARMLLDDPNNWCQGSQAKSALNRVIGANAPGACRWCGVGAVIAFSPEGKIDPSTGEALSLAHDALDVFTPGGNIIDYNDGIGREHLDILKVYDHAIDYTARKVDVLGVVHV